MTELNLSCVRHALPAAILLCLVSVTTACAQGSPDVAALKKEIDALKAEQAAMRRDLNDIKNLLNPAAQKNVIDAPPGLTASIADAATHGSDTAPVILLEFSDYECPYCAAYFRESYPAINRDYVSTGKVRYVFRSFPLEEIHKNANKAHQAALCAGSQGKYWEMHERLFSNSKALALPNLIQYAQALQLDVTTFTACLESGTMASRVSKDIADATKLGISGTPFFLIGTPGAAGEMKVLKGIHGKVPFAVFQEAIDGILAGK
jgi:protein-disulfide isomerase